MSGPNYHPYLLRSDGIRGTDPPAWQPRAMAEWEEIQGLLITWTSYTSILKQIVDYAQEECVVYIVCSDSNSVINTLTSSGIPLTNVKFLDEQFNSIWCRDYGQWNIYRNDAEEISLVDWIYNRPRPKDDVIPEALANFTGLPIYEITQAPDDLVHTGGNFMVDGHGTGFSSKLILKENGPGNEFDVTVKTEGDIDTILNKYMGLNRYVLMDTLPYDEIHHIDMHLKLLDEETLLAGEFPEGVSDGPQIEENLQYIQDNFLSCYGRPYKIVRIPMPPSTSGQYAPSTYYRTYTNSVFVNKSIIVPTYRDEYDTTALRIYKEQLPGYKICPIDCDDGSSPIIAALGAIHCITKEVGASDPIWIDHAPLQDTLEYSGPFLVEAKIKTPSGVNNATLYWRNDTTQSYNAVPMTAAVNDTFFAYIPYQSEDNIQYYINAESNSGRSISKPLVAPEGYLHFDVLNLLSTETIAKAPPVLYDPYPNPASVTVQIGVEVNLADEFNLKVVDLFGKTVTQLFEGSLRQGPHKFSMDVSNLSTGIYYVMLSDGNYFISKKLVVSR
jgi:agmatine/peptidylarginine deiminase